MDRKQFRLTESWTIYEKLVDESGEKIKQDQWKNRTLFKKLIRDIMN